MQRARRSGRDACGSSSSRCTSRRRRTSWRGPAAAPLPREAHIVLRDRDRADHLRGGRLAQRAGGASSWRRVEGVQAPIMAEEFFACEELVRADPRWQEAMRRRGVTDFALAMIDPWASSYDRARRRPGRAADRAAADLDARGARRARLRPARSRA